MPSRLPPFAGVTQAGSLPSDAVVVGALDGTTDPSDCLSTRCRFALGLSTPPLPDVGGRGGSLLFRAELSPRARLRTPEPSCTAFVRSASTLLPHAATRISAECSDAVCCLRRDMTGSASSPFRALISRGCKASRFRIGPAASLPTTKDRSLVRALDAPLRRRHLCRRPEPATWCTGAYHDGTSTRKLNTALIRTHHGLGLYGVGPSSAARRRFRDVPTRPSTT